MLLKNIVCTIIVFYSMIMRLFSQYQNPFENKEAVAFADSAAQQTIAQFSLKEKVKLISGSKYFQLRTGFTFITKGHLTNAKMSNLSVANLPDLIFTDGPRGITTKPQTNFPAPIARACSWNTNLEEQIGEAMALEAKYSGSNLIGAPCINVLRHSSNGRAQESYGEDTYLVGNFSIALIKGIQRNGVMACAKHFALNSIENTRYHVNVKVDERSLHEVYLPHFKRSVEVGVASLMTAYNKVNNEYCAENKQLCNILRNKWNFKGFTQSDWDLGMRSTGKSILAQMDIEMPMTNYYSFKKVKKAIDNKEITEKDIDKLVYNSLFVRFLFHKIFQNTVLKNPDYTEHAALAKQTAQEGTVLLKNENNILPFDKQKIKSILLVGRLATKKNDGDVGSSGVKSKVITPLEALKSYAKQHGIKIYYSNNKNEIDILAKETDAVLIITGLNDEDEGEYISLKDKDKENPYQLSNGVFKKMGRAGDRYNLNLKKSEIELIQHLSTQNKNTVVFLIGGSAIMMEDWKDKVNGIFFSGYHGMNGAATIPEILFGDINPSGKLAFSISASEKQLPEFPILPKEINYGYYHGYTLLDKQHDIPAFAFGFGLSYTQFEITCRNLITTNFLVTDTINIEVNIKNTGNTNGAEVVQAYIHFTNCKEVDMPEKLLKAFEKVFLKPHEEKTIVLKIPISELAYYDVNSKDWKVERTNYTIEVANSSRDVDSKKIEFEVH